VPTRLNAADFMSNLFTRAEVVPFHTIATFYAHNTKLPALPDFSVQTYYLQIHTTGRSLAEG
jgi:hypothetical protein